MDDIAIATKDLSLPLHEAAVSDVLQVAKDNSLFFKLSKSVFHVSAIDYLGVILEKGKMRMDPAKVSGVRNWPTLKCVKDVRSFHGFCNFYQAFIAGFSKIALPLNTLTKKGQPFMWTAATQQAFDTLKQKVTEEPILLHPILTRLFELEVDASGFAIGAVLMHKGDNDQRHPVGFYSTTSRQQSATTTSTTSNYWPLSNRYDTGALSWQEVHTKSRYSPIT